MLSELNSHIRMYGPVALMSGNSVTYLVHLRDEGNRRAAFAPDRIQRRREKFHFADFATRAGARCPKTVALVADGKVRPASSDRTQDVASFLEGAPRGHYFCKPNAGRNGIGAFRLTITADRVMMDEEPSSAADIAERLSTDEYLIQEWMAPLQHRDISRFRDGVINTMRLITFDTESGAKPVAASLRMAISLKSIDSWSQGGVVAAIDLEQGVLKPFGILKKGLKLVETHPASGVPFRDQPVPHFQQAISLACRMHGMLAGPNSLGWDIGLLEDGPCFLEANGPWDILMSAQLNPDLVPSLLAFHLPPAYETTVRVQLPGTYANRIPLCWSLSKAVGVAMASGRVEHVSHDRAVLTIGGTHQAVQTALQIFKRNGAQFGASGIKVATVQEKLAPGFEMSAMFAGMQPIQSAHPA